MSKVGVCAAFAFIMKKTESFWRKKEVKTQRPDIKSKEEESDEKVGIDNDHRGHGLECKADT